MEAPKPGDCKKADIEKYLKKNYNLKKNEFPVLTLLLKSGKKTVKEIAESLSKDRSTIQKIVSSLYEKGFLMQRQKNLALGGYVYIYSLKEKQKLKTQIKAYLDKWYDECFSKS